MKTTTEFKDPYGKSLHLITWMPNQKPVASVQILHGMAEHAERYNLFANALNKRGFVVYAHDHRGHGHTDSHQLGFIAESNGFSLMVENIKHIHEFIREQFHDIPIIMFGHSMGSFLLQRFFQVYDVEPDGIIYSGSSGKPPLMLHIGSILSSFLKWLYGAEAKSPLLERLSFGAYNKEFKPNRTYFDWLSRDNEMVDLYIDDPLCGFTCSTSFYHQLFNGLLTLHSQRTFADHNKNIPVLIVSGDNDPVSDMGKGIKNLEHLIRSSGVSSVDVQLYPGGRHEMLNETNRSEVIASVIDWIEYQIKSKRE